MCRIWVYCPAFRKISDKGVMSSPGKSVLAFFLSAGRSLDVTFDLAGSLSVCKVEGKPWVLPPLSNSWIIFLI